MHYVVKISFLPPCLPKTFGQTCLCTKQETAHFVFVFLIEKTIHTSQIKFCFVCSWGWIKLEYPGKIPKKLGSNNYIKRECLSVSSDIQALISGLKK